MTHNSNKFNVLVMSSFRILFFFIGIVYCTTLSAQCDTLKLRASFDNYIDSLPEYHGKFEITESNLPAILRLEGKEQNITLPYSFEFDSLNSKSPHAKLMTIQSDKSSCVYFLDLQAKESKIDFIGIGTAVNVGIIYTYLDKTDTLIGKYHAVPKDSVAIDTVIYGDINFYFPTLFSPNNDYINDDFRVFATENVLIDRIEIYDRWGNSRYIRRNIFSDEIKFGSDEKVKQGDLYVGYLVFRNKIIKRFEFSVVEN